MASSTLFLNDQTYDYLRSGSLRESELMAALRAETAEQELAVMQITPEQGQFMAMLVRLTQAARILEIGTFTGYSALAMAQAMPLGGRLIACDISEEWTGIAQRYWAEAGVADRVELRLAPALETLDRLLAEGHTDGFDLAFIDADKVNYSNYYERCLKLLRPGGLIMVDNVLWGGSVADESDQEPDTCAIRSFNAAVKEDPRVEISMVSIGDGLMLLHKR